MQNNLNPNHIVFSIINNEPVGAVINLNTFRDIYNQLRGRFDSGDFVWILVFMSYKVYAQPVGYKQILLEIIENKPHFYRVNDFEFIDINKDVFYGTYKGKYRFLHFVSDIVTKKGILSLIFFWIIFALYSYSYISPVIIQNISGTLINALAIFVTIFCLFVLNINPDTHFRFAETDRFHKLTQSDKYISYIAIGTLIIAIITSALGSAFSNITPKIAEWNYIRAIQSVFLSSTIIGTIGSLWLVLNYHFQRRNEIIGMNMAKEIINNQQRLYEEQIRN